MPSIEHYANELKKAKTFKAQNKYIDALKKKNTVEAAKALLDVCTKHESTNVLEHGLIALGEMRKKEVVEGVIEKGLRHKHWRGAIQAANALGEIGDESAIDGLFKYGLTNKVLLVKTASAKALGKIGKKAVKPLIGGLKSEDPLTVVMSAYGLAVAGDKSALPHLMILSGEHEDANVRTHVKEAIEYIQKGIKPTSFGIGHSPPYYDIITSPDD